MEQDDRTESDEELPGAEADADTQHARSLLDVLQRDLSGEETLLADRYLLSGRLGHGAHGTVHAALDRLTGERVAVKLLPPLVELDLVRLRGEIASLRLLRLPGVVHLFDEGVDAGRPFLVMERVDGAPFPGKLPAGATRWSWEQLRAPALALLDTLARVHAAGLVHRDLKPRNVLVTPAGRPVLLDFGLSVGRALADDSVADASALGTPAYAAPEQVRGDPVDARADLYALGVMLWEALAGRRPHDSARVSGILRSRLAGPVESLGRVAPDVPREVVEVVDALLEVEREARPRSAVEVAERLRGEAGADFDGRVAFVGREAELVRLLDVAKQGRGACVVGGPGSGRTRLLQEVAARLAGSGRQVAWLLAGTSPFESLGTMSGWLDRKLPGGEAEAREAWTRALRAALAGGAVIVADDLHALDEATRTVLAAHAGEGVVLGSLPSESSALAWGEVVALGPLSVESLREIFAGNDRLLHVHEDAALELRERTAGVPASVAAELEGWRRAGLVEPAGLQLLISRASIDRLRGGLNVLPVATGAARAGELEADSDELLAWIHLAWPNTDRGLIARVAGREPAVIDDQLERLVQASAVRALPDGRLRPLRSSQRLADAAWVAATQLRVHATLAEALAPGVLGRLYHLVASGDEAAAAHEALVVAEAHLRAGRLGDAEAALTEGLRAARRMPQDGARAAEHALFRAWLPVALGEVTPVAADRLLYELGRSEWRVPDLLPLERLVRAATAAYEGDGDRALQLASMMPSFTDPESERWRHCVRAVAARRCPLAVEERVVDDACAWARRAGATAAGLEWEGRLRYRQGRFRDAADVLLQAAAAAPTVMLRVSALLNAASALLEVPALDECEALAAEALETAARCRLSLFEGRARWMGRTAGYRRGAELEPDVEFVDALEAVGAGMQAALGALTEAAIAWRRDENSLASALAARAARSSQSSLGRGARAARLLARALECVARGEAPEAAEAVRMSEEARTSSPPLVGLQVLALLSRVGVSPSRDITELHERARAARTSADPTLRREILAPVECERDLGRRAR